MDADGDFIVAWVSNGQDGSLYGVYAQQYAESTATAGPSVATVRDGHRRIDPGGRLNSSIRPANGRVLSESMNIVNGATGANSVRNPSNWRLTRDGLDVSSSITSISFGINSQTRKPEADLILSGTLPMYLSAYHTGHDTKRDRQRSRWKSRWPASGSFVHNFSIFSARPLGTESPVNTTTTNGQTVSSVAMDADGDYVVTWQSYQQDGSGYGVYAQRYNANKCRKVPSFASTRQRCLPSLRRMSRWMTMATSWLPGPVTRMETRATSMPNVSRPPVHTARR